MKDFFFRVASLTFEANVLSELERSGSRHVGDIISESTLFSGCYLVVSTKMKGAVLYLFMFFVSRQKHIKKKSFLLRHTECFLILPPLTVTGVAFDQLTPQWVKARPSPVRSGDSVSAPVAQ